MEVHRIADGKPVEVVRRDGRYGVDDRLLVGVLDDDEVVEVRDCRTVTGVCHLQRERHRPGRFALSVKARNVLIGRIIVVRAAPGESLCNAVSHEHVVVRRNRVAVAGKRKTGVAVVGPHVADREADGEVVRNAVARALAVGEADPAVGIERRLVRPGVGRIAGLVEYLETEADLPVHARIDPAARLGVVLPEDCETRVAV